MIHQYVRVYDDRTGNPSVDNRHRAMNRAVNRACRNHFRITVRGGRRRKKYVTSVEYARYVRLVAAVADYQRADFVLTSPRSS